MDKDSLKKGIAGVVIGAGLATGIYAPNDKDPITGYKYREIVEQGEQDVYYFTKTEDLPEFYEFIHQKPETIRFSLDGTTAVIKADISEVDRGVDTNKLGKPYTHEETLLIVNGPEWVALEE